MAKLSEGQLAALEHELARAMRGEVRFDDLTRAVYSTDSSNYRQVPLGVVFPLDHGDVQVAARTAAEAGAPLLARGAGTSLAGQACNEAVILDMSRHMRRIVEIDPDRRLARAEPGVVLDDLRRVAERHGLTFGPDPATHAWCTLGGMIGNNACGTHGLYSGKTSDNVEALRLVLASGEELEVGSFSPQEQTTAVAGGGLLGRVVSGLQGIDQRYGAVVRQRYPRIPRRVSGYNLDELSVERGFHVARALVGTESTCALSTGATLRLVTSPKHRSLVVLGYPDIFAAAEAVPALLAYPLLALEGFDRTLVDQMIAHNLNTAGLPLLPEGNGWLLAEVGSDDADEASQLASELAGGLPATVAWRRLDDPVEQRQLWAVRESGLGATAIRLDGHHNLEGWEDGAVPPERLAEYLRGITALWAKYGYSGAWYGHFGQGCVHTRNNFDLASPAGLRAYRAYVSAAAELVTSLGGSLSGEHGDGQSRAELLGTMFGEELVQAFREFKAVWDPSGLMNPGKVVDPYPLDSNIRYLGLTEPVGLRPSGYRFGKDGGSLLHAALRCVGVGRCRREDSASMCPSYRATHDEVYSTRGRAKLLSEMFQGDVTPTTWRNEEVREALELCLSCKACASDCPTHVDMATYKSEFLYHYYRRRLRPLVMYATGLLPWGARWAADVPALARFANLLLGWAPLSNPVRRLVGVTTARPAPRLADEGGLLRWAARAGAGMVDRAPESSTVVVWPDTFTEAFAPQTGRDLVLALQALGERVTVPSGWACCGRTLYDSGMLDLAKRSLRRLLDVLEPWVSAGVPVIVPEPSCLAAFRDELPALLGGEGGDRRADRLGALARSPAEHVKAKGLLEQLPDGPPAGRAVLHPHCHQRSVVGTSADEALLAALGYEVEVLDAGCCGLAGAFGFDARHEALSRKIGEELWLPKVRAALTDAGTLSTDPGHGDGQGATAERSGPGSPGAVLVLDGFSCRTQLSHLGPELVGQATTLPAMLLAHVQRRHVAHY
jgi:FAD/FMN-containing dehydrogenase/Fe-S oxidoreductase